MSFKSLSPRLQISLTYLESLLFCLWLGGSWVISFGVMPLLFRQLPRVVAGEVAHLIFPPYFILQSLFLALLLSLHLLQKHPQTRAAHISKALFTAAAIFLSINIFWVNPKVSQYREELHSLPSTPERLEKHFYRMHGLSMGLNAGVLFLQLPLLFFNLRSRQSLNRP